MQSRSWSREQNIPELTSFIDWTTCTRRSSIHFQSKLHQKKQIKIHHIWFLDTLQRFFNMFRSAFWEWGSTAKYASSQLLCQLCMLLLYNWQWYFYFVWYGCAELRNICRLVNMQPRWLTPVMGSKGWLLHVKLSGVSPLMTMTLIFALFTCTWNIAQHIMPWHQWMPADEHFW